MADPPPTNESWWPSYTAWQAFAVKVLVEGGRNQDSNITRVYGYRDRMPVFAIAHLHDALIAKGEASGARVADLRRRMSNAILPESGSAHVEELADPYLLWFWNSNIRSTAIVLNSVVKGGVADAPMRQLVRWMMAARKDGRWGNTQENALAMEALVAYYRKYESTVPDFRAVVSLGARELARNDFRGRSTEASTTNVPMVGPDQGLLIGGLLAPVRLRWLAFQLRANTRAFAVSVMAAMFVAENAPGRRPPPEIKIIPVSPAGRSTSPLRVWALLSQDTPFSSYPQLW